MSTSCPKCGHAVADTDRVCPVCQGPVATPAAQMRNIRRIWLLVVVFDLVILGFVLWWIVGR